MRRIDTATKAVDKFGAGRHGFNDGNKAAAVAATQLNADWCDTLQEEIANVIENSGTALDPADPSQLAKAIQSGHLVKAAAAGTANAITATFSPSIEVLTDGMMLFVRATSANTTAAPTFTPNSATIAAKTVVKGSDTALAPGDIHGPGHWLELRYDQTLDKWVFINPATGAAPNLLDNSIQDLRLTLTTGVPVTTADVIGAGTIYCTPYKGNRIALFDGTMWSIKAVSELSLPLSGLVASRPYDVFCYDNSGTPTLVAVAWTNDTARATALTYQGGVLVQSGNSARRYLGTFYTTGVASTEDSAANRYLWNYHNRVEKSIRVVDATASWTYTTQTWRQANANAANQANFVRGLDEDAIKCSAMLEARNSSAGANIYVALGLDGVGVSSDCVYSPISTPGPLYSIQANSVYHGHPGVGKHAIVWLEQSQAVGTTTFFGTTPSGIRGGLLS